MIDTLRTCGFDIGLATYVAPAPEKFRPFAGGAAAAPVGWQLPPSSWPLLRFALVHELNELDQQASCSLSPRVLYELQVLRDSGAPLRLTTLPYYTPLGATPVRGALTTPLRMPPTTPLTNHAPRYTPLGALLRPEIDEELISELAAAEMRHGGRAVQRRYGEHLTLTLTLTMSRILT